MKISELLVRLKMFQDYHGNVDCWTTQLGTGNCAPLDDILKLEVTDSSQGSSSVAVWLTNPGEPN